MATICVDSCFFIGLYDERDQHHASAVRDFIALFGEKSPRHVLAVPWPILYECLGTRYSRDLRKIAQMNRHWRYLSKAGRLSLIEDQFLREGILAEHFLGQGRSLSLVDRMLRALIFDPQSHIDALVTYNIGDFADACAKRGIPLINQHSEAGDYAIGRR